MHSEVGRQLNNVNGKICLSGALFPKYHPNRFAVRDKYKQRRTKNNEKEQDRQYRNCQNQGQMTPRDNVMSLLARTRPTSPALPYWS
jgi:hypothetical protein